MIDPITIMTAISLGLKVVDQFRDLAIRVSGKKPDPPSAIAEKTGATIQIRHRGGFVQEVTASQIHLNEWDDKRYQALERRVKSNWSLFNDLYAETPELAVDERVRIKLRMERIQGELCIDFSNCLGLHALRT